MKFITDKNIKETFWAFLSKGGVFLFYYLIQLFFIEVMEVEQWGKWSLFVSLLNIAALCSTLGTNLSVQKYIAQYSNEDNFKDVLNSSIKLRLSGSVLFIVFLIIIFKPLLRIMNRMELYRLYLVAIPYIFLFSIVDFFNSIFQGFHRLKYNAIIKFIEHGLKAFITVGLFLFINKLATIILSYSIAYLLTSILCIIMFYNIVYKKALGDGTKSYVREIFLYSIPLFIMVVGAFISIEVDTIMLNLLQGDYETAIYSTAKQVVRQVPHISLALSMGIMPLFANMNESNKKAFKKKFDKWFFINLMILFIILLLLIFISPIIIPWLFNHKYDASIIPLQLLSPYVFFMGVSVFTGSFLDYRGLAKKRAVNLFIAIVLNIILNYFFIKSYGAIGASIATTLSFIPYFLLNLYEVKVAFS